MTFAAIGTMGRLPEIVADGSTLDEGLWSHIVADANVSAIIGQRCFPNAVPQGEQMPAAVYQLISSEHDETMDGASGLATARYQISAWAATRREAKMLADALRLRLQSYRGMLGSVEVQDISLAARRDVFEPSPDKLHQSRFGVQLDFEIWFIESVPTH